jgi:hypothetical protein
MSMKLRRAVWVRSRIIAVLLAIVLASTVTSCGRSPSPTAALKQYLGASGSGVEVYPQRISLGDNYYTYFADQGSQPVAAVAYYANDHWTVTAYGSIPKVTGCTKDAWMGTVNFAYSPTHPKRLLLAGRLVGVPGHAEVIYSSGDQTKTIKVLNGGFWALNMPSVNNGGVFSLQVRNENGKIVPTCIF